MDLELEYLLALGEARSCLAALADSASDVRISSYFDGLLIRLDRIHRYGPATDPIHGDPAAILDQLMVALIDLSAPDLLRR